MGEINEENKNYRKISDEIKNTKIIKNNGFYRSKIKIKIIIQKKLNLKMRLIDSEKERLDKFLPVSYTNFNCHHFYRYYYCYCYYNSNDNDEMNVQILDNEVLYEDYHYVLPMMFSNNAIQDSLDREKYHMVRKIHSHDPFVI